MEKISVSQVDRLGKALGCPVTYTGDCRANTIECLSWLCSEYYTCVGHPGLTNPDDSSIIRWLIILGLAGSREHANALLNLHPSTNLLHEILHIVQAVRILRPQASIETSDIVGEGAAAAGSVMDRMNSLFGGAPQSFTAHTLSQFPDPSNDELTTALATLTQGNHSIDAARKHYEALDAELPQLDDLQSSFDDLFASSARMQDGFGSLAAEADAHWDPIAAMLQDDCTSEDPIPSHDVVEGHGILRDLTRDVQTTSTDELQDALGKATVSDLLRTLDVELKKTISRKTTLPPAAP